MIKRKIKKPHLNKKDIIDELVSEYKFDRATLMTFTKVDLFTNLRTCRRIRKLRENENEQ